MPGAKSASRRMEGKGVQKAYGRVVKLSLSDNHRLGHQSGDIGKSFVESPEKTKKWNDGYDEMASRPGAYTRGKGKDIRIADRNGNDLGRSTPETAAKRRAKK